MRGRAALAAVLLVLSGAWLSGLDFGATLDNMSSYGNQQIPGFTQKDRLAGWLTTSIGSNLTFAATASAQLWNLSPWYILNVDQLNLAGQFPRVGGGPVLLDFTVGRYFESDFTGLVFSQQSIDGFQLGFGIPGLVVTADVGYTGLTLNPLSYIVMTEADAVAQGNSSEFFGSPRVVERLQLLLPGLFLQQDLTLTAILQQDMRSLVSNVSLIQPGTTALTFGQGGSLDSEYFGAGLSGALAKDLYYSSYAYLETGRTLSYLSASGSYQYEPILAALGGVGVHYYLSGFLGSTIGLDLLYASGDADFTQPIEGNTAGNATAFLPITTPPRLLALAFSPNLENLAAATLSYSVRPFAGSPKSPDALRNLQAVVKAIPMLRPTTGALAAPGIAPSAVSASLSPTFDNLYLGSEFDLVVNYRPLSDLGVALSGGLFLPNASVFVSSALQYYAELDLSLSF